MKILPITQFLTKCLSEIRLNEDFRLGYKFYVCSVKIHYCCLNYLLFLFMPTQCEICFAEMNWWFLLIMPAWFEWSNKMTWHTFLLLFFILTFIIMRIWWVLCLLIIPSYFRSIPYYKQRFLIVLSSPSQRKHKLQLLWILLIFYCVKAIEAACLRLIKLCHKVNILYQFLLVSMCLIILGYKQF